VSNSADILGNTSADILGNTSADILGNTSADILACGSGVGGCAAIPVLLSNRDDRDFVASPSE
jgi:hypothetical protein